MGVVLALALVSRGSPAAPATTLIDDGENANAWSAHPADGVQLTLSNDAGASGRALRLDFDFGRGGGYAVARRVVNLDLPENYVFTFRIRGRCQPNHLEFKLLDASGDNVWWSVKRDWEFPHDWRRVSIKKRQIQYAWGPLGGGEIRHVAALEIVVTAGSGGRGTVWIDDLELQPLPPADAPVPTPIASASSRLSSAPPAKALDGDSTTAWITPASDPRPWIQLDLGAQREFGGLTARWAPGRFASGYVVETSNDGRTWEVVRTVQESDGGRDDLALPECEARWLRLRVTQRASSSGVALREVELRPLEWSATRNAFFAALAAEVPAGTYPRSISGEQPYWTVVGAPNDRHEGLLDTDGRFEVGRGRFAIEPLVFSSGKLHTWNEYEAAAPRLMHGCLPIPTARWHVDGFEVEVTAFTNGVPGASAAILRYRISNPSANRRIGTLYLAARPFQVNPPAQFLNGTGGAAALRELGIGARTLRVEGATAAVSLTRPSGYGATTFDAGEIVAGFLRAGRLPPRPRVTDSFEAASAAWAYPFALAPGASAEVTVAVPLHPQATIPIPRDDAAARAWVSSALAACTADWEEKTSRVTLRLPEAAPFVESLRSQLGWILVNQAGPAIQPGARAYARSWIRDGALTCSALLRLGHPEAVREFIAWFAPHQYDSGKIPCVVDGRGADPVPEHDSNGEFIYLVAEYERFTGDRAFVEPLVSRALAAATYLDSLRQMRRTPEYRAAGQEQFFGLLPPSISHEGYSAKAMHSYWDDFWAVRGFRDAVWLAERYGRTDDASRFRRIAVEFEAELAASVRAAQRLHRIDFVPGCADLGDFDATSTTIALAPTGAAGFLPEATLRNTFTQYLENFDARRGGAAWEAYTPYEIRNAGACVRLGWRDRGTDLLQWFLADQKPPGWRQWPEVVWHDARTPHFLGDLPHTWVGSDYIRSMLDLLAYERETDGVLVLAAGVPMAWLEGDGVEVRDLRTPHGRLSYTLRRDAGAVVMRIDALERLPDAGILVQPPLPSARPTATLDGRSTTLGSDGGVFLHSLPATLTLRP